MRKLLVASQKGGVGKTTTSMNLAAATALTGTRVLLLDADPLSNISTALHLAEHPQRQTMRQAGINLPGAIVPNLIPSLDVFSPYDEGTCADEDFARLLRALATPPARRCYGCIIVDVPPFLGGSAAQLLASCDDFLLVMRVEEMAHRTLPAFMELVQRSSRDGHALPMRGILLTLPEGEEPGCRCERELRGRFGMRVLPEVIPHDDRIGEALRTGRIGSHLYPDSPAARQYHQLVAKLDLAGGASPGIELEEILQALREAAELAGTATAEAVVSIPAPADPPRPTSGPSLEAPLFAPISEPVKPAAPGHRPRRLSRSGESTRPTRPERVSSAPAAPVRRKGVPTKGQPAGEENASSALASAPSPQNTSHALAQLWPLWILLGAVLGGGLRLLPLSPSLLPVLVGLGAALLVVVVLFTMAGRKRVGISATGKKTGWLRNRHTKKPATPPEEAHQDFLSARLASLASNSKNGRRPADTN